MLLDMTCVGIHAENGHSKPLLCPHAANLQTVACLRFCGPYEATGGPRFHCLFVETEGSDFDLTSHTKERPTREIELLRKLASGRGFDACPATDVRPFFEHYSFWEVNAVLEQQHSSLYQWIHKISCIRHMFQFPVQIANHAARSILHARIDYVFLIASGISGSRGKTCGAALSPPIAPSTGGARKGNIEPAILSNVRLVQTRFGRLRF